MGNKICVFTKAFLILSGGVVLIVGVKQLRASEVKKLSRKLSDIKLSQDDFGDNNSILNDVYSELTYQINDIPSIYEKYINDEIVYSIHSYIPTLSNDLVSYTFYDDYIRIDLLNNNEIYGSCYYNSDGSYYIICNCKNSFNYTTDDRLYSAAYSFSKNGVLLDSSIYDGFFKSSIDCIDNDSYTLAKTK